MVNALSYREVARFCGGLFAILSLVLIVFPQIVFVLLELSAANSAKVIAGRAGVLFAGLAFLMLSTATHRPNITLNRIADATAFLLMALAALGVIEWVRSTVGPGIWIAVVTEVSVAALLWTTKAPAQSEDQNQ